MIIKRAIQIHGADDCIDVLTGGNSAWICINVTSDESVTVFLTESQMRHLANRLEHTANKFSQATDVAHAV